MLYQTERWSPEDFTYVLQVPDGTYVVSLYFAEVYPGTFRPGARVFDIYVEEQRVLPDWDIYALSGPNAALERSFLATVDDGELTIRFARGAAEEEPESQRDCGGAGRMRLFALRLALRVALGALVVYDLALGHYLNALFFGVVWLVVGGFALAGQRNPWYAPLDALLLVFFTLAWFSPQLGLQMESSVLGVDSFLSRCGWRAPRFCWSCVA